MHCCFSSRRPDYTILHFRRIVLQIKNLRIIWSRGNLLGCGGRIRTYGLRVMSRPWYFLYLLLSWLKSSHCNGLSIHAPAIILHLVLSSFKFGNQIVTKPPPFRIVSKWSPSIQKRTHLSHKARAILPKIRISRIQCFSPTTSGPMPFTSSLPQGE